MVPPRQNPLKIAVLTSDNREVLKDYRAPAPYFGPAPEALLQGLAQVSEVEVHVVSCTRVPMAAPENVAPNTFFNSLHVPKLGWMRTFYLGCIRATRKKLKEIQPDIVHGQGTELDCGISAVFSGFPNVLTIHGNMRLIAEINKPPPFSFNWLAARLETLTIPRSKGVVCITRYTQAAVAPSARRTWVVPNAVDASFFDIDALPPPGATPRVLCVGLICLRKNQNAFIRALDPLAAKQKFEVLFLGKTTPGRAYDDEFLSLVRTRPWCLYEGHAGRETLKQHLQSASLLALPSLEDNCPMVVLEAMAAGVPVVAANVGGVPDLIEEGRTGFFCDPLQDSSMRAAVEKALTHPAESYSMAQRAKAQAKERFSPRVIAQHHLKIYREVLALT
jgi:glycosyltransferase involved in cell wall biosynthesis